MALELKHGYTGRKHEKLPGVFYYFFSVKIAIPPAAF